MKLIFPPIRAVSWHVMCRKLQLQEPTSTVLVQGCGVPQEIRVTAEGCCQGEGSNNIGTRCALNVKCMSEALIVSVWHRDQAPSIPRSSWSLAQCSFSF